MTVLTDHLWQIAPPPGAPGEVGVLFPFAGGSAYAMPEWVAALGHRHLIAVQYPGRGRRLRQPPAPSIRSLATAVMDDLRTVLPGTSPLLIGHSMGALVAYETARQMEAAGLRVEGLVVSAALPPGVRPWIETPLSARVAELSDTDLGQALNAHAGLPAELLAEPELLALTLPVIRHDFEIAHQYAVNPEPGRLSCPILALGGNQDVSAPPDLLPRWAEWTTGPFAGRTWPGNHFYFRDGPPGFAEELTAWLPHPPQSIPGR